MEALTGKVAVVTGIAKGGTGFGIASAFLEQGSAVVVSDIDEAKLAESLVHLEKLGPVVGCLADVTKRADAQRTIVTAVERFGRLDVLVNNAVRSTPGLELDQLDDASIWANLGTSLYGTIYHMQAAFPFLKERGGSIINFGSINGLHGAVGFSMYAAAKEGVRGLSRSAAREWGRYKIRINVVCPASMSPEARIYLDGKPELLRRTQEAIPLGYIGDGHKDIAPVAVFLASDASHYVSGQTINVDGGRVML